MSSTENREFLEKLIEIDLDKVISNRYQPRKVFLDSEIRELALSIEEVGLLQPPLVMAREGGVFEIIAGERRVMACRLLGRTRIPALVRWSTHFSAALAALVENVQRVDLNPIEIAHSIERLMKEFGMTQEMVAEQIGKERPTVANYVRLLQLPIHMQEALISNRLTMAHAKVLLATSPVDRDALFMAILRDGLTVRQAEKMLKKGDTKKSVLPRGKSPHIVELERKLEKCYGTKVEVEEGEGNSGRLIIHYYSLDDLERLCDYPERVASRE